MIKTTLTLVAGLGLAACASTPGNAPAAASVLRHPNASADSPTSRAVEVVAGTGLVFVSGQTPEAAQPQADRYSAAYWGDTEAQTRSVFNKIDAQLKSLGLGFGDVVKMQVFLVGDPLLQGRADAAGFARAYAERFGSAAQPLRPARTTVQVAALGQPGMRVEIDVIAARR